MYMIEEEKRINSNKTEQLDDTDKAIIQLKSENLAIKNVEIAKRLGLHEQTILARLQKESVSRAIEYLHKDLIEFIQEGKKLAGRELIKILKTGSETAKVQLIKLLSQDVIAKLVKVQGDEDNPLQININEIKEKIKQRLADKNDNST